MLIGVVSDIHCQHAALESAISAMSPVDALICLGDVVDQTRFCNRTVAMLRDAGAMTILGNHDEGFLAGLGRLSGSVAPDHASWLASRPVRIEFEQDGHSLLAVHSTPWKSGHAYISPADPQLARFAEGGHDVVLYGHTHQPLIRQIGTALVVNPGSVGEGRPTSTGFKRSCALIDLAAGSARIIDLD